MISIFAGGIWRLVVQVGGMAAAHGTTYGRVIGAMLLGFASVIVLILLIVFAVVFGQAGR